jgi:hypothetical protein
VVDATLDATVDAAIVMIDLLHRAIGDVVVVVTMVTVVAMMAIVAEGRPQSQQAPTVVPSA